MPEREGPRNRAQEVVDKLLLGDPKWLKIITKENKRRGSSVLRTFSEAIAKFTPDEATELSGLLLSGIGTEDKVWNSYRRETAIVLLGTMPLEKVSSDTLLEQYVTGLKKAKKSANPLGAAHAMAEAGIIVIPYLPLDTRIVIPIGNAWEEIEVKLGHKPGWDAVKKKRREMGEKFSEHMKIIFERTELENPTDEETKPKIDRNDAEKRLAEEVATRLDQVEDPVVRDVLEKSFGLNGQEKTSVKDIAACYNRTAGWASNVKNELLIAWGLYERRRRIK